MKVLIIALGAQVREALEAQLDTRCRAYLSVGLEWLQTPADAKETLTIPKGIDIVVNAATLECLQQQVDEGQLDDVVRLAKACERAQIPLIQLSNSQVFDGLDSGRHREDDDVAPTSAIGGLLVRMEALVQSHCQHHIIVRTGPLFSASGDNVLTRLLSKLNQHTPLSLSSRGKGCPTYTRDLARVVSAIIDQLSCGCEGWGTYHYSSSDPASHYQFAETLLAVVSQYSDVNDPPLLQEPLDEIDKDWAHPLLNCEKILNTFGIKQLPWRAFVTLTVQERFKKQCGEAGNE